MIRQLSKTEKQLWDQVRQTVRPLNQSAVQPEESDNAGQVEARASTKAQSPKPASSRPGASKKAKPPVSSKPGLPKLSAQPALASFSQKEKRRYSRGAMEPDARLDLHGMRQTTAFHALLQFLRTAYQQGNRTVLVITGKGGSEPGESGVLRRAVPHWLTNDDFRPIVSGIEPAARRHGGDGALYVRLRRNR